jgi:hypothetical protein
VARHGAHVSTVEHDHQPRLVRYCGRAQLVLDSCGLSSPLPLACLNPQGDGMGAVADALMVCWRGGQQSFEDPGRLPERGARPEFSLHTLQPRRAPGGQQLRVRRERHLHRGRREVASADLEPRRLDRDGAEQGLQSARAPVLEGLEFPAVGADPAVATYSTT